MSEAEVALWREEDHLRRLVSRRAPFTALLRSVVAPSLRGLFD